MGLDQEILRGKHKHPPLLNQKTGKWMGAKSLMELRKCYWLHNRVMNICTQRGMDRSELNCKLIPLDKWELQDMIKDTKECIKAESMNLINSYFDFCPSNDYELDWVISEMKDFNMIMSRYLKNQSLTEYFYWSWW